MKRALVTGGAGFIGSNLVKELVKTGWFVDIVDNMSNGHMELLEGLTVRQLPNSFFLKHYKDQVKDRDQKEVLFVEDEFANLAMLQHVYDKNYDVIFHQAAIPRVSYSVENPSETTDTNIADTVRLFEAAAGNVKKVIFASSSSVYGGADNLPTAETEAKNPKSPYAWQKSAIEDYAKLCADLYNMDITCLRYFNVFGPGQYGDSPYSTAVSAWCHAIKNGLECRSDGDGAQTRDMCYIDNVVHANIKAAQSPPASGECFNVACGDYVSNREILEWLSQRYGEKVKIRQAPERPGDVKHTQANILKSKSQFGYEVKVRFWEGLEKTVKWWGLDE